MRIAAFSSGYLPAQDYGGPVRSLSNFVAHLGDDAEIFVIASEHDFRKSERMSGIVEGWNTIGKAKVLYLPDEAFQTKRFSTLLAELRPDVVYLSSIFSYRITNSALFAAKKAGIPVVLAPRGELEPNALRHGALKKRAFLGLMKLSGSYRGVCFHATSDAEAGDIRRVLHPKKIATLSNLPVCAARKTVLQKQANKLRICCIARILPNKNQLLSIRAVAAMKEKVVLDIYGPIEDTAYWQRCQEEISRVQLPVSIRYCGSLRPEQVSETLLRYDCFLLPTAFENYCHSIVEAMLNDCPVVISRGTTPWDEVEDAGCGRTVPLDRPEAFTEALSEIAALDQQAYAELLERLHLFCEKHFQVDRLAREYLMLFDNISGKDCHERTVQ